MEMRQRDEEKRSKAWRITMLASTVAIVVIVLFFVWRSVAQNPLEGEWVSDEKGVYLDVDDDGEVTVEGTFDDVYMEVELLYTLDKSEKSVSLKALPGTYQEAVEDANGRVTAREVEESLEAFVTSYYYSVENDVLTLTERESGNQFIFDRIRK